VRSAEQKMLNAVQRPEVYREVVLSSAGVHIVLSVWDGADGPVVLFLPGTMTHPLFYEEFLDALNRAGFTVAGLHGQGHGKSPRAHRPLTFASLVEDGRDAVTWIHAAFPGRPLAVVGSSQGSVLAMALAATDHRLDAVFAHNILDPTLPSTIQITPIPPLANPCLPRGPGCVPCCRAPRAGRAGPVRRLPRHPPSLP
jgi:alpha-beta hydrolase superfamily lysophospholipase